jgi:chromosome segregation ATPase
LLANQYLDSRERIKGEIESAKELQLEKTEIEKKIIEYNNQSRKLRDQLDLITQNKNNNMGDKNHYVKQLEQIVAQRNMMKEEAGKIREEYESMFEQTETNYPGKVEMTRKHEEIEKELTECENIINERERQEGVTMEDARRMYKEASELYSECKGMIINISKYKTKLSNTLALRRENWSVMRTEMCVRVKSLFADFMTKRGYRGRLVMKHKEEELEIIIETNETKIDKKANVSKRKDTKSLSGGEKSFSTISLLLALWSAMESPLRALDEFDVFMDAVNRRMSIQMLTEFANQNHVQYILITPQDTSTIPANERGVRIIRMSDPQR